MTKKNTHLGVGWHLPTKDGKKFRQHPFTTTTQSVSDGMRMLAEDGHTFKTAITACHYLIDEKELCEKYVEAGYGDVAMSDWVK